MDDDLKSLQSWWNNTDNKYCADCGIGKSRYASINLGVFLCYDCTVVHNSLNISKVKSVEDNWNKDEIKFMKSRGNKKVNEIYNKSKSKKKQYLEDQ